MLPTKDSLHSKEKHKLKVKGWKKIFQVNDNQKREERLYFCQMK